MVLKLIMQLLGLNSFECAVPGHGGCRKKSDSGSGKSTLIFFQNKQDCTQMKFDGSRVGERKKKTSYLRVVLLFPPRFSTTMDQLNSP